MWFKLCRGKHVHNRKGLLREKAECSIKSTGHKPEIVKYFNFAPLFIKVSEELKQITGEYEASSNVVAITEKRKICCVLSQEGRRVQFIKLKIRPT